MIEFILALLLIIAIAVIIGGYKAMKIQLEKVQFYENWIIVFKHRINTAYELVKAADIRGSFEADDEVGDAFKNIKDVIDDLEKFTE